jgi:hypothetical protein
MMGPDILNATCIDFNSQLFLMLFKVPMEQADLRQEDVVL